MKKRNIAALCIIIGCILMILSLYYILNRSMLSIVYGVSFSLLAATLTAINFKHRVKDIYTILFIVGLTGMTVANIILISNLLYSLLFSLSLIVLFWGLFIASYKR